MSLEANQFLLKGASTDDEITLSLQGGFKLTPHWHTSLSYVSHDHH